MDQYLQKKLSTRYRSIKENKAKNTPSFTSFLEWARKRWINNKACEYCGRSIDLKDNKWPFSKQLSIDHRLPLSQGGDNRLENLAITCNRCNMIKTTMNETTYRELLFYIGKDDAIMEKILRESNKGRVAYKLERLESLNPSVLIDLPEDLLWQYLSPQTTLFCPDCHTPLSGYFATGNLICLKCSQSGKEKIFKVVEVS